MSYANQRTAQIREQSLKNQIWAGLGMKKKFRANNEQLLRAFFMFLGETL